MVSVTLEREANFEAWVTMAQDWPQWCDARAEKGSLAPEVLVHSGRMGRPLRNADIR